MAFDIAGAKAAGYSDAEIADHLAGQQKFDIGAARQAGYGDADIIGHLSQKQAAALPAFDRQPASAGTRFVRGLAEPIIGVGQLAAHGLGALPVQALKDNAATYDDFAKQYTGDSAEVAPEGVDWARIGGNVATLAPTGLAGGVPSTLFGVARAGAVAGGLGGAATPTEGGDGYGWRKAGQTALGAGAGAILSPVAQKLLGGISTGGAMLVNRLKRAGSSVTPQQVTVQIHQVLQNAGIDPATLPPAFMQQVTGEVAKAMQAGGTVSPEALANSAAFAKLNMQGTRGQIGQDPMQFGTEAFVRNAPGGEPLAAQYKGTLEGLNQRLGDIGAGAAPPVLNVDAGAATNRVLQQADARGKSVVDELYAQVRSNPDADRPIDFGTVAQSIADQLYRSSSFQALPATLRTPIEQTIAGRGAQKAGWAPTIRTADDINKTISGEIAKARAANDGAALHAIGIYKQTLDEAVADAAKGSSVADDLFTARGAAAQRFGIHEAIPALKAAVDGTVPPDKFMSRFIHQAPLEDVQRLSQFIQQASPDTWQQLRGQIIDGLRQSASKSGQPADFSQAGFSKALESLRASGKLPLFFNPDEIQQLQAIGRVGHAVQKGPPGVSYTGFGGQAKAMGMLASLVGRMGKLGAAAQHVVRTGGNALTADAALAPAPVASVPLNALLGKEMISRIAGGVAPAGAGGMNALLWEQQDPRGTAHVERY